LSLPLPDLRVGQPLERQRRSYLSQRMVTC